jgi:hypothetical protein
MPWSAVFWVGLRMKATVGALTVDSPTGEAFVLAEAIFEGNTVNYCPFIFVDNDAALALCNPYVRT